MSKREGNKSRRASSPQGVQDRFDRRLNTHPKGDCFPKATSVTNTNQLGRKPGSRNPKKVGR